MTRCPKCGERLPRTVNFVSPSHGRETLFGVIATIAGWAAILFAAWHKLWPPDWWLFDLREVDTVRLGVVSMIYGLGIAIEGVLFSGYLWWHERHNPPPEPRDRVTYSYDHEVQIGDGIRAVTTRDGQRRWLRERGFVVPAEPIPNALTTWLWAVVDKKATFSQRGARASVRDNGEIRKWATDIMALFCVAGWATPASGWLGNEPDMSQGVSDYDADVLYDIAREGYPGLLERLEILVDESVENPPHPQDENDQPAGG